MLNIYLFIYLFNIIYRQVSFLVATQAFQIPVNRRTIVKIANDLKNQFCNYWINVGKKPDKYTGTSSKYVCTQRFLSSLRQT